MAHTMFGASLTMITAVDKQSGTITNDLRVGAPLGANCGNKVPVGNDSLSMDSFGTIYNPAPGYISRRGSEMLSYEYGGLSQLPSTACFVGITYCDAVTSQKGLSQADRNLLGFSGHLSKDKMFFISGAPMFRQQAGFVQVSYRDDLESNKFTVKQEAMDINLYFLCDPDKLKKYKLYNTETGKEPFFRSIICDVDLTYGYSLGSLQIAGEQYLATGGPRAQGIHGEIRIFKFTPEKVFWVDSFSFLEKVVGRHFNTGFGTTILGADLDGDGTDELLVGEPYKTDDTSSSYNSGIVSIYKYDDTTTNPGQYNFVYQLVSPTPSKSNMFGFKVVSLGDVDADGGEDILVSALREEHSGGTGRVHLYSGRSISSIYTVISRSTEYPEIIQSFSEDNSELYGFSVGDENTDLDGNGFSDLVVGDPGKNAQKAHIYYAKTVVRVLFPDKIPARLLYEELVVDETNCPVTNQNGVNFCQPFTMTFENRGIFRSDPIFPNDPPVLTKWAFEEDITVSVKLSNQTDQSKLQLFDQPKEVVLGPSKDSATLTFWIYGIDVPEVYGTGMHLVAETTLKSPSQIKLKGSSGYKAETVLASSTFKDIDIAISPVADVTMNVRPKRPRVRLGSSTKTLTAIISLNTISGELENFVNGELQIKLGTTVIGFTCAYSEPEGLASCRREGFFVNCKFAGTKKFQKAKLTIVFLITGLVDGVSEQTSFPISYKLTWANRKEDVRYVSTLTKLNVVYYAKLTVVGQSGSVAANAPFIKSGINTIDYSVVLENEGESQISKTDVSVYAPYDPLLFSITVAGKKTCDSKGFSPDYKGKCSYSQCQLFGCSIASLGGLKKEIFSVTAQFSDGAFWKKIVTEQETFTFTADWNVVQPVRYKTNLENMYPENKEGSVTMGTVVIAKESVFPWWVVVVTLLVSIAIVSIIIIVLYRKGFFTKKDPKLIYENDIGDDEFVDPDQGMTVQKNDLSSA